MGLTKLVVAAGTVDSMIAADDLSTSATCGRIGLTDGTITRCTRV